MTEALRWSGVGLVSASGLVILLVTLLDADSLPGRIWARYIARLEEDRRFVRMSTSGRAIAAGQALIGGALVLGSLLLAEPMLLAAVPVVLAAPILVLRQRREKRILAVEAQLPSWLLILANGLRAAPSLGEAIRQSIPLVEAPLSEELDVAVKEMRLGMSLDTAVVAMGQRLRSVTVRGALASILAGRETGGELSSILERTAASIREMTRLEGVLRAKTAEGRSQAYVLGAIPFFLIVAIQWIDPHWLDPLTRTSLGLLVTAVSMGLWVSAILLARRILAVDL